MPLPTGAVTVIYGPTIIIKSVTPEAALENTETVTVQGDVINNLGRELRGELRYNDGLSGVRLNLTNDRTPRPFAISGLAPPCGAPVSVSYVNDDSTIGNYAYDQYNSRARFELAISKFLVNIRRHALFDDVIQATAVAKFNDQFLSDPDNPHTADPEQRSHFFGNVPPGIPVPVRGDIFRFMTFDTTADGQKVLLFSYVFQDLGPSALQLAKDLSNLVSKGAAAVLASAFTGSGTAWIEVDKQMEHVHDQMYGDCGASVLVESFEYTSSDLISESNMNGVIRYELQKNPLDVRVKYPCQVGLYTGTYEIRRTSWRPVTAIIK